MKSPRVTSDLEILGGLFSSVRECRCASSSSTWRLGIRSMSSSRTFRL
jgi:hypothetical protein